MAKLIVAVVTILVSQDIAYGLFYSYGTLAGDGAFWDYDDGCVEPDDVTTATNFTFLGTQYDLNGVSMCSNGIICLDATDTNWSPRYRGPFPNATDVPAIAVLYADWITEYEDSILYARLETSGSVLTDIDTTITAIESDYASTAVAFIATWVNIEGYYAYDYRGTFQAVLATDGSYTFLIKNYHGINTNSTVTAVGFGNGISIEPYYNNPYGFNDDLDNLLTHSNIGEPGRWLYRVDPDDINIDPNNRTITSGSASDDDDYEEIPSLFFDFGILAGDILEKDDDDYMYVDTSNLTVFGNEYFYAYVSTDGVMSFGGVQDACEPDYLPDPLPYAEESSVFALWIDLSCDWIRGVTFLRYTNSSSDLDRIDSVLDGHVPNTGITGAVIGTWVGVPQFGFQNDTSGTFQVAVATNGIETYAIFHYHELNYAIYNETAVAVGFDAGDNASYWLHPLTSAETIGQLVTSSNVGVAGRWIYGIADDFSIIQYADEDEEEEVEWSFRVTNLVFSATLTDTTSNAYLDLYDEMSTLILEIVNTDGAYIISMTFESGSVVVNFELGGTSVDAGTVQERLVDAANSDGFGAYDVDADSIDVEGADDDAASAPEVKVFTLLAAVLAAMWTGRY